MKSKLFDKAIAWTEKKGFKEIKANTDDFETPTSLKSVNKEIVYIPDITGEDFGNRSYLEIVNKDEDKQYLVSKWKLLCVLASRKGGKLYLLAGRGYKAFAEKIVKDYNLYNTTIVSI